MASLCHDGGPRGTKWRVITRLPNGRRHTIRLGRVSKRIAEQTKRMVQLLEASKATGQPYDPELIAWLGRVSEKITTELFVLVWLNRGPRQWQRSRWVSILTDTSARSVSRSPRQHVTMTELGDFCLSFSLRIGCLIPSRRETLMSTRRGCSVDLPLPQHQLISGGHGSF